MTHDGSGTSRREFVKAVGASGAAVGTPNSGEGEGVAGSSATDGRRDLQRIAKRIEQSAQT